MPFILPYTNLYQQTISSHHKRNSKQNIMTPLNVSPHLKHILNIPQKKKSLKHSQENSDSILLKIPPPPHKNTKLTGRTRYTHSLWKWFWNYYSHCLCHESPTKRTFTQSLGPCYALSPWWRRASSRFSPQISYNQKWNIMDDRSNRKNKQPNREIHHGTVKD